MVFVDRLSYVTLAGGEGNCFLKNVSYTEADSHAVSPDPDTYVALTLASSTL